MFTCLLSLFTSISPATLSPSSHIARASLFFYCSLPNSIFPSCTMALCYQILSIFSPLHFTPPCVSMLSPTIYFFSRLRSLPPSRAALLNPIYHFIRHIYSFTFTHTPPFSFLPTATSHPHNPTGLGSQYPLHIMQCLSNLKPTIFNLLGVWKLRGRKKNPIQVTHA